ncbi:MMPL family transporter [Frankia sp. CNm7]|uniref:MMPL family transporter n=1 Tax=Frankia nepalensis TaxID=1836974 RepID=A0A937RSX1_9ACTN|nr:MMPL family transporter [Frankia nepalensis]MBL7498241.1 MMPL family transporter [Frankia nepalensis]MBL7509537.1 MMPL family transporter [Frankia nepalensis]MBL7517275.1 MMPL family transporter [Frankia nepalensis]MBL7632168.1 MMPL family transporter [Frankia nepalensis]
MSVLARWCARHRFVVLGAWAGAVVVLIGLVVGMGSSFRTVADLPDSESAHAYTLLGPSAGSTETGRVVWHTAGQAVDSAEVRGEVTDMLAKIASLPGVEAVASPYAADDPSRLSARLNTGQNTAYADVTVTDDVEVAQVQKIAQSIESDQLQVETGGQAFAPETKAGGIAEAVGILAALLVLLLMFRSAWAAALPIITGVVGVVASLLFVMVGSHVVDLSSESITMGSLIGLGVGIDYALFIVDRHRKALLAGASVTEAVGQAGNTSGRAVIFAGLTVIAALLAMFVVGMGVLTGMGQAAAVTVAFTVLAAITLLPALLSVLGQRVLSRRQRRLLLAGGTVPAATGMRARKRHRRAPARAWAGLVTRVPKPMAVLALVVLAALAIPVLSMRVGEADASSDPAGSASRQYYELMSPAFGGGVDATLVLVAETPDAGSVRALDALVSQLPAVPDVASVSAGEPAGDGVQVVRVTPSSSSGAEATVDLVHHLRRDVIPNAEAGSHLEVYVGGRTATDIDVADALMSRLPLYLALVAGLGFLLLVLAFRSVLVPLVGAVSNLATIAVGLGALTAIFQWGWGSDLLGVGDGAPISYIVPVMIVGVMFGLSMDYQVFLVSRMREEWAHTRDNAHAIRVGVAETAKVIATAAVIMLCVFSSFGFSGQRIVSCIGVGLALAVVVDAFVVRMVLVPALLRMIGDRVWAYPRWAERVTPRLAIEGPAEEVAPSPAEVRAPSGQVDAHPAGDLVGATGHASAAADRR